MESEKRIVEKVLNYATENNQSSLYSLAIEIQKFISYTVDLLSIYEMEEQLYITDYRDQLVHSSLNKYFNEYTTVKYVQNGELKKEKLSQEEYREIQLEFHKDGVPPDTILNDLRKRFEK